MTHFALSRRSVMAAAGPALAWAAGASAPPPEAWTLEIESFDGEILAYRTTGLGRPPLLLHGFLSSAQ
ncbi:MAG: hypothetical protein ACOYKM_14640 [Caulobacterales bacterium]|jgi:hypothetical protein